MKIKKFIAIVFSCGVIASVGAVSASAYTHSYSSTYSFTDYGYNSGTKVLTIGSSRSSSTSTVKTKATNNAGISVYMSTGTSVYSKSGSYIKSGTPKNGVRTNGGYYETSCDDYRSVSTNVYYQHSAAIYGDTTGQNSSSLITSKAVTVG